MSVKFQVNFDKPQEFYYSGQTLSGEVHLVLLKPKQIKCINVNITGIGQVSWSSYQVAPGDHRISLVEHSGKETYIDCRTCSYSATNGGQFELSPGEHFYRFKYVLPNWLPSSFEGTHGFIRYAVEVILERRPLKSDCTFKKPFSVCRSLNLNQEDSLGLPAQVELRRKFDLGFLLVQLNLLKTGFVICEESTLPVRVDVANSSGYSLNSLHLQLRKIIKYKCDHPVNEEKEEAQVIATDRRECLVENDQRKFMMRLAIPMTPPTTISYCKVIHIWYELKLGIVLPGCAHGNPYLTMPITLGTTGSITNGL